MYTPMPGRLMRKGSGGISGGKEAKNSENALHQLHTIELAGLYDWSLVHSTYGNIPKASASQ